jgi:hypothetical protein
MTLISTVTVGAGGTAQIDVTSIPTTYTDLYISCSLRLASVQDGVVLKMNPATGQTYNSKFLQGYITGVNTGALNGYIGAATGTDQNANTFSSHSVYIPNYATSNAKSFFADGVGEVNSGTQTYNVIATTSSNLTAAINAISLTTSGGGSFIQYSTVSVYGIN